MITCNDRQAVLDGCLVACRRCFKLVCLLTPEQFASSPDGKQTIGAHLRHCLDHFASFLRGVETGVVDYDNRERDPDVERNKGRFLAALESIMTSLERFPAQRLDETIRVRQLTAPGQPPAEFLSSAERELAFLSGHTIHHLAITRMLARDQGVHVPEELVLAYSTAAHRATVTMAG